ncbi:MAG: hypothetical protein RIB79_02585 [Allomuricauda sp.]|jgi:AraC family transcriptional regulator, transcriptional activator of pobA
MKYVKRNRISTIIILKSYIYPKVPAHIYIDRNTYKLQPPIIFFIRKEQVHYWNIKTIPQGYVAIIKKRLVDKSIDGELKKLLAELSRYPSLKLSNAFAVESIFKLLINENNFTVSEGLLKALFAKIIEPAQPHIEGTSKRNGLFQSFTELLSKSDDLKKQRPKMVETW